MFAARRAVHLPQRTTWAARGLATISPVSRTRTHKVVVVGAGSAGIALSHQLLRKGPFGQDDIALVDPAQFHHYQPGWTLVGGGFKNKEDLRKPLSSLLDPKFKLYNTAAATFQPQENQMTLADGHVLTYDQLVVVPGISLDYGAVHGLSEALADPDAPVSTIYDYAYCDKAFRTIRHFNRGDAIFTQPAGVVKCAGAPQKIMWLALDHWKRAGLYKVGDTSAITITFATGLQTMFGVPKYAAILNQLRIERGVDSLFSHELTAIKGNKAIFHGPVGQKTERRFDLLHVAPRNQPHAFIRNSPLANQDGYVDVDDGSTRHKKFANVWSIGDASSLPTSKTVAAITAQAPVMVSNLLAAMEKRDLIHVYDGYTSCPLLTGENKVLLAEFKYGGQPKETFNNLFGLDQGVPRRAFYYLKKDFFPWVYAKYHVKGVWGGPKGFLK